MHVLLPSPRRRVALKNLYGKFTCALPRALVTRSWDGKTNSLVPPATIFLTRRVECVETQCRHPGVPSARRLWCKSVGTRHRPTSRARGSGLGRTSAGAVHESNRLGHDPGAPRLGEPDKRRRWSNGARTSARVTAKHLQGGLSTPRRASLCERSRGIRAETSGKSRMPTSAHPRVRGR